MLVERGSVGDMYRAEAEEFKVRKKASLVLL